MFDLNFSSAASINDSKTISLLKSINANLYSAKSNSDLPDEFCKSYINWIKQHTTHNVTNLEQFKFYSFSQGTTEAFDKFYIKHNNRRFRCFSGEYMYHQLAWRNSFPNWKLIEDAPLEENDAVIISIPFADTGNKHTNHNWLIAECEHKGIPVLVDCAYFSIADGIDFDFSSPAITDITFSLSKAFPVSNLRIGMRLTREDDDDIMFVYKKSKYQNSFSALVGLQFLGNFPSYYIFNNYRTKQLMICDYLNITPSNTVIFGIGGEEWQKYNRGSKTNRLSFHRIMHLSEQEITQLFKG